MVLYRSEATEAWPIRKTEEISSRIFGPYKNSRTGEWSKRHNQELQVPFQPLELQKKYPPEY